MPWDWKNKTSITEITYFIKEIEKVILEKKYWIYNISSEVKNYEDLYKKIVIDYNLKWIIKINILFFKILTIFNKNKYSYIIDTFWNDKILD
jgi:hypothetical protein